MVQYSSLPGANVQSLRDSRLTDVKDFEPDIVILQIGTNDLADPKCTHDMLVSAIKDLVDTLLYTYHVRYVAVLQILHRFPSTVPTKYKVDIVSFNEKVDLSNDLLSKELLLIDHCRFWMEAQGLLGWGGGTAKSDNYPRRCLFVQSLWSKKIFL